MGYSIVFVDWRVADIDSLIAGMPADAEVDIIDGASDGLDQIAARLQGRSDIDAIHIISHGSAGSVYLGSGVIDSAALATHTSQLDGIGKSLTESGDILLYGCNVAAGNVGVQFIGSLALATGADVAASTDLTGAGALGGNWMLESSTSTIETRALFADAANPYAGVLADMVSHQPNYDIALALDAAQLSQAAYHRGNVLVGELNSIGWTPLVSTHPSVILNSDGSGSITSNGTGSQIAEWFGAANAFAFAATHMVDSTKQYAISFQGSDSLFSPAILTDWLFNNAGHHGFSKYYEALRPLVEETLFQAYQAKLSGQNVQVVLTGHSLGGAAVQAALLDIFVPKTENVWGPVDIGGGVFVPDAVLGVGDRLGSNLGSGKAFDGTAWDTIIASLRDSIVAYTFGAPSISVDTLSSNPNLSPANASFLTQQLFQFEHKYSFFDGVSTVDLGDPVAKIGTDYGTVINVDLLALLHSRYEDVLSAPQMHSMNGYVESLTRAITDSSLFKLDTYDTSRPTPPEWADGGPDNDLIIGTTGSDTLHGYGGNDILVARGSGDTLDGGAGDDSYVVNNNISGPAFTVTIAGPAHESRDTLYLPTLQGEGLLNVNAAISDTLLENGTGSDLVLTLTGLNTSTVVTIKNYYNISNHFSLHDIEQVIENPSSYWTSQSLV